jgi:Sulfatase-modifying factor enzyme 1
VAGAGSDGREHGAGEGDPERERNGGALVSGGATQLGTAGDHYAPCANSGQNCANDIYAVSLPGVLPSANITWFQAQQACKNARKRLPSNAEWQAAVAGTRDPGLDDGTTKCNTHSVSAVATGSRKRCVSSDGAFDMVGNLWAWVADWVPRSNACGSWGAVSPTGDHQCLAGAATTGEPGALLRGGYFGSGANAGPLAVGRCLRRAVERGQRRWLPLRPLVTGLLALWPIACGRHADGRAAVCPSVRVTLPGRACRRQ